MNILTLIIAFSATVLLTGIDQLIKYWAVENLQGQPSREFIKIGKTKILDLTYLENDGAVFGSFSGMRWVLLGITFALMIFCIYYLIKHKKEILTVISTTLIISGGLGNIIDRLFRGGLVVDYLDVQLFDFAIFNFADCCVVVGVVLLLIQILFFDKSESKKNKIEAVQTDE
ncbi:MAG: signal peptidase II [Oscillospiraceae bacterium]|nr:signal peptidase II [Oscillospiraceae bacterium]